jgi:DNA-binding GntR family transcriptional regulator
MPQEAHGPQRKILPLSSASERRFPPNSVAYRNMAEQIAAAISQAIATGKLAPGTRLPEMRIAREMGTSRGPVREALFQLEREGLVDRKPNRGTFVIGLTEELVRQIASLRGVLEGFAASLIVKRMTREDDQQLERIIGEMSAMARAGNFRAVMERDYQFHEYIVRASRHSLLHETWVGLDRKTRIYLLALDRMFGDMNDLVDKHMLILKALREGDSERVSRVMADHMVGVLEPFVTRILRIQKSAR